LDARLKSGAYRREITSLTMARTAIRWRAAVQMASHPIGDDVQSKGLVLRTLTISVVRVNRASSLCSRCRPTEWPMPAWICGKGERSWLIGPASGPGRGWVG
jgi:hypothetical protein